MIKQLEMWILSVVILELVLGCSGTDDRNNAANKRESKKAGEPPNVLIISLDTTRADHLACYGYKNIKTPNLDSVAAEGVLFEEAFSVQPVTLPAHASIFTGKYPFRHGVRDNNIHQLADENQTLAEVLTDNGYMTTAFVASYILNHGFGLAQGFRFYNDRFVKPKQKGRLPVDRRASEVSFLAGRWLEEMKNRKVTQPFFLWLHYYDPHADYNPPHPYRTAYGSPYDGEIAYMDDWLGYVFDDLKRRNLWNNTMVVLVGDHGEGLGDHEEQTHGMFIYRSTTHVPLIIKFPKGKHAGKRVATRVSQVDIFPTVLEELGFKGTDTIDGKSLFSLITGKEKADRETYSETYIPRSFNWSELKGIRIEKDFYIRAPRSELYDISTGRLETQNVHDKKPEKAEKYETRLDELLATSDVVPSKSVVLTDELSKRLEALGYFVGEDGELGKTMVLPDPKERIALFNTQQKANGLIEYGFLDEALKSYEQLVTQDEGNPRFVIELANLYSKSKRYEEAIKLYKKAMTLERRSSRTLSLMGDAYKDWGKNDTAIEYYKLSLEHKEAFLPLFNLSVVYLTLGNWGEAEVVLKQAQKLRSNDPSIYNNLGYIEIAAKGNFDKGIELIQKAVAFSRNKAPYLASLGSAYFKQGDPIEAAVHVEKALELVPDSIQIIEQLEQIYRSSFQTQRLKELHLRKTILQKNKSE